MEMNQKLFDSCTQQYREEEARWAHVVNGSLSLIDAHSFEMLIQERREAWGRINQMALENPLVSVIH